MCSAPRADLPCHVVAVLLGPEPAPAVPEEPGSLRAEDSARRRIAVRHMDAGDLVVTVVGEARLAGEAGVYGRGGVTPLGQPAHRGRRRVVAVVAAHVEHPT